MIVTKFSHFFYLRYNYRFFTVLRNVLFEFTYLHTIFVNKQLWRTFSVWFGVWSTITFKDIDVGYLIDGWMLSAVSRKRFLKVFIYLLMHPKTFYVHVLGNNRTIPKLRPRPHPGKGPGRRVRASLCAASNFSPVKVSRRKKGDK